MKPYIHAKNSVKKWGGTEADYIDIHNFMDSSKAHLPDMRHRALLHNSFGCYIAEMIFGYIEVGPNNSTKKMPYIINSDGKRIQVRDIVEKHIIDDLGFIPTVQDYFKNMELQAWFSVPNYLARVEKEVAQND